MSNDLEKQDYAAMVCSQVRVLEEGGRWQDYYKEELKAIKKVHLGNVRGDAVSRTRLNGGRIDKR